MTIEDQGQMGSCSGQAMSSCLELLNWFDTQGEKIQLSRMFAYLSAQKLDGLLGRDTGATISGAVKAAKTFGICLEETFPYPPKYSDGIPARALNEASKHRLIAHAVLNNYDDVFNFLASGVGAVEIGIPWRASLANNNGVIDVSTGKTYGGHALAIVGFVRNKKDNQNRKYLIMANSHGRKWGKNGFALIAPRLFDEWSRDNFSEMIGMSDLEEFRPRLVDWINDSPWV